ncbi:hypothetical protein DMR_10050 [Solidesulfovibrio magneticus RS-1]|uniref:Uncharacterized protein n=1 Tax=Solidesulfovibrio magneticus (strain ATCC 700980 / DSM 13731 / RS-1) TaxID=573370 RepID=C4XKV7_SOLM1|nr:hypothetical protein DMR_10050 [Solidesulfovibrio magneticus RS-1]
MGQLDLDWVREYPIDRSLGSLLGVAVDFKGKKHNIQASSIILRQDIDLTFSEPTKTNT